MKLNPLKAILTLSALAVTGVCADGPKSIIIPEGSLTAFPSVVQAGTKTNLTWKIDYPLLVTDVVTVGTGEITAKQTLDVEVRVVGAGVTVASSTNSNTFSFVPTEAQVSYNSGSYTRVFYDTNTKVDPSKVVYKGQVTAGKPLRFGGRYFYNNKWGPYFNSQSGTRNVRTLVNGQVPPTTYPLHTAPTLESFIKPYLDNSGKVKIGPMDVIVFMELTHTDAQDSDPGYDLQDMVLLVTYKVKNNNGHGNNVDGVDSSNPGKGIGGPNGGEDPSGTFDDEKK